VRLLDYPGLSGQWPPPPQAASGEGAQLDHCLDVLIQASWRRRSIVPEQTHVRIATKFEGLYYVRDLTLTDEVTTIAFCEFLNRHAGETIQEIGELDVKFLR